MLRQAGLRIAGLAAFGLTAALAVSCVFELRDPLTAQSSPGQVLWAQRFGDASNEIANGVAIDTKGNVLVAGTFDGTLTFGGVVLESKGSTDIFLVKLDPEGVPLWSRQFGGVESDGDDVRGRGPIVAVDAEDNVILTGTVVGTADLGLGSVSGVDTDAFVLKVRADGELAWSKRFTAAGFQKAAGVAVDAQGSVLLTGGMEQMVNFGGDDLTSEGGLDLFVVKLSANGDHLWSRRLGDISEQKGVSLAVDPAGNIVIAGALKGTITFSTGDGGPDTLSSASPDHSDVLLMKLEPDGKALWARRFGGAETGTIQQSAGCVAVTASGGILLTGYFLASLELDENTTLKSHGDSDVFLVRFDSEGKVIWANAYGNGNDLSGQVGWAIASDAAGQMLVAGSLTGNVEFGSLTHTGDNTDSKPDAFVLKVDSQHAPVWNRALTGPGVQEGYGIAADPLGNVVMVGVTNSNIKSLDPEIMSRGGDDIIVVKLAP